MLLFSLAAAVALSTVLWLCAAAAGLWLLGGRWTTSESGVLCLGIAGATGWALLGSIWFLLAWAGKFTLGSVLLTLGLAAIVGFVPLWRQLEQAVTAGDRVDLLWLLPAGPMFFLALLPPHGFDALNYHLPFARAFAADAALPALPTLRFEVFPAVGELWQAVALLVGEAVAFWEPTGIAWCAEQTAKALALGATVCCAAVVAAWARPGQGLGADQRRWTARLAAALWLSHPLIVWLSGQAYVEITLTLFVVSGLWLAWRATDIESGRTAMLAGLLLGAAASVKYLGLVGGALGALVVLRHRLLGARHVARSASGSDGPAGPAGSWRQLALLLAVAGLVAAPTYLRLTLETGNPVYPFFESTGNAGGAVESIAAVSLSDQLAQRALWFLSLPWSTAFGRQVFHGSAPLSPWMPVLCAILLWLLLRSWSRLPRSLPWTVGAALFYSASLLVHDEPRLHHLMPAVALLAVACAVAFDWGCRLEIRWLRSGRFRIAALLIVLLPSSLYGAFKVVDVGGVPWNAAQRRVWLQENLVGYEVLSSLEASCSEQLPCAVYLLGHEPLRWYASSGVRAIGDLQGAHPHHQVVRLLDDTRALRILLRDSWQVDYLLIDSARGGPLGREVVRGFEVVADDGESLLLRVD